MRNFEESSKTQRAAAEEQAVSVRYKVMGHDTFAREDYFVGEFATKEEAEACVRAREERVAKTQDEALRDEFWIVPPSERGE